MGRIVLLVVCIGGAIGCPGQTPRQPPTEEKPSGGGVAMSPELEAFLTAEDLDDVADAREGIKTTSAQDTAAIRSVLGQWRNPQAISNLLFHPDLIPEDIRVATLFRGLAEREVPYYALAVVVGFGEVDAAKLSGQDRRRAARELLALVRGTADVRAQRASLSFRKFADDGDVPEVFALVGHPDDTVQKDLKAWLFDGFKGRGAEPFADAARRSSLARPVQQRIIAEFNDFLAQRSSVPTLFAYVPNLRDFKPSAAQGAIQDGR